MIFENSLERRVVVAIRHGSKLLNSLVNLAVLYIRHSY